MTFAEFLQIATAIGGVVTFGWGVVEKQPRTFPQEAI
jgi:hypothetical protein